MRTLPFLLGLWLVVALGCGGLAGIDTALPPPPRPPVAPAPPAPLSVGTLTEVADFPAVLDTELVVVEGRGPRIVQYSDWRCPHCYRALDRLREAARAHDAQLVYRNFPLSGDCNPGVSRLTDSDRCELAYASVCADGADRFDTFAARAEDEGAAIIQALVSEPGFADCMAASTTRDAVYAQARTGADLGIQGTPTVYVEIDGTWKTGSVGDVLVAIE